MAEGEYARDLIGYGRTPPHPRWPDDARLCVQFVINYEEGGENDILHGDPASEAFLSEIVGAQPWPGQRHMNMESIYEYGSRAGFWRLWRMFTDRGLPRDRVRRRNRVAAQPGGGRGHEGGGVGDREPRPQMDRLPGLLAGRGARAPARSRPHPRRGHGGRRSAGTRAAPPSTPRGSAEEGRFLYTADSYADELPYWVEGPNGPQLVVPYTLDANDMRFATPQGFNAGDQFFSYLKDSFDVLYAEGETAPKMMSVGLHCRLVGRPGRAAALARFLDYVASHERVWAARRIDIARHWMEHHPPGQATASGGQPSERSPEPLGNPAHGGSHNG